jgi:hypothetical protein
MGAKRNAYRSLVGKPVGRRPLERSRHRWVDNVKMNLGEIGGWIGIRQDRDNWRALVKMVMNLQIP